jgi:hypothetical protein
MRDRGITRPGLKAGIAAAVAASGAAVLIWSLAFPDAPTPEAPMPSIRPLGMAALIAGLLLAANYFYAWRLVWRLRRGEGVIGSWTVAPDELARFRDAERARGKPRNNWRLPRGDWSHGLPVIFSADAVLAGHTLFRLAARGMSRFTHARIAHGSVPAVEFSMRLTIVGAGTQGRTARYRGHLRLPIAADAGAEAARAVGFFQRLVP